MFKRVQINNDPYLSYNSDKGWFNRDIWPCDWVTVAEKPQPPFVAAYRLSFRLDQPSVIRAHVTADNRYELFLDGQRVGRGSERGDPTHWFFETYEMTLEAGAHTLVARAWSLGGLPPGLK